MEISKEKIVCQMLELKYNNLNNISSDSEKITNIYPFGWFSFNNYNKKIEILSEAIKNNILITKTKSYQDIIERVEI